MTDEEWRVFVTEGTRTGKLATMASDGSPRVTPIWFLLDDDGSLVFTTGATTAKARAIARDPRVSLCVDDQEPPYSYVTVHGTAATGDDLNEMLPWATRIAARYMGSERAEEYGRRNAVTTEVLVRITPTRVVARVGVTD